MDVVKKLIDASHVGLPALFAVGVRDTTQMKRAPFGRLLNISVKVRSLEEHGNFRGKVQFVYENLPEHLEGQFASCDEFYDFTKCQAGFCHTHVHEIDGQKVITRMARRSNFKDQKDETEYQEKLKIPGEKYLAELMGMDLSDLETIYYQWKVENRNGVKS